MHWQGLSPYTLILVTLFFFSMDGNVGFLKKQTNKGILTEYS